MDSLLDIALRNAVMATVLAVLAASIGAVCRRPALVHGLWLLVLLKLITPPVLSIPLPWPVLAEPSTFQIESTPHDYQAGLAATSDDPVRPDSESQRHDLPLSTLAPALTPGIHSETLPTENDDDPPGESALFASALPDHSTDSSTIAPAVYSIPWRGLIVAAWLGGSLLWLSLTIIRLHRFREVLGFAQPAPESLRKQTQQLAVRLDLPRCPEVWLVPGRVSPMVWALGRPPRLFLPIDLWRDLDEQQRATLLVHELAHLARRDSWVRGLELVVMGLYWWHPVVWWACRELREAEEQCCDAWVIWAFPQAARTYAMTLVKTVDFLSETRSALPTVASGIGHVHNLRRRLTMIMRGTTPRMMSSAALLAVLALGAFFLPLLPSWAQDNPAPRSKEQEERNRLEALERVVQAQRAAAEAQDTEARTRAAEAEFARSKAQVEQMAAQVEQAKAQLEAATAQLRLAQERLAKMEIGHKKQLLDTLALRGQRAAEGRSQEGEHRLREVERKLDAVLEELQSLRREIRRVGTPMPPGVPGGPGRGAPGERRPPSTEESPRQSIRRPGGADGEGQPPAREKNVPRPANRREKLPDDAGQPARKLQP